MVGPEETAQEGPMIAEAMTGHPEAHNRDVSLLEMLEALQRGSALVDAALNAIAAMRTKIGALKSAVGHPSNSAIVVLEREIPALGLLIDGAYAEDDNLLLVSEKTGALAVFTLARQTSGGLAVQSIEIDRSAVALSEGDRRQSDLPFDQLVREARMFAGSPSQLAAVIKAIDRLQFHISRAVSRLSIAKARFDLQSNILNVLSDEGPSKPSSFDTAMTGTGARDLAVETRELLSGLSLNISNGLPLASPGRASTSQGERG